MLLCALALSALPLEIKTEADLVRAVGEHYTKHEHRIPMRDGVTLFTHVYTPKDRAEAHPIILLRTPYGIEPYGVDNYPTAEHKRALRNFAPAYALVEKGFIFVHQDVRGRMMSGGEFVEMRPHRTDARGVDESTDAYDTIDWLVKHVPNNNRKVGVWGNSYPGFYAAQAAVDAHPALKAVSPQAPVTEWFLGDDFHHNGAFCLADAFLFFGNFGRARAEPVAKLRWDFDPERGDLYDFFLKLGPLKNADAQYLKGEIAFWNELMRHGTRDAFWQARDPRSFYKAVKPAVLTVGGLFDAEDLFGALATYHAFETQSPGAQNGLVLGPWRHGGWFRTDGDLLGDVSFATKTALHYREKIVTPFFMQHLLGAAPAKKAPEAWVFETGSNEWRTFDAWPPPSAKPWTLYLRAEHGLSSVPPPPVTGADSYVSDPHKPVPYTGRIVVDREAEYMVDDQRYAARRPDVLVYELPITEEVTVVGPIAVDLWVATTSTDADFVVKVIDGYPDTTADPEGHGGEKYHGVRLAGFQQLVRGEIMRAKFRNSFEKPEPFVPDQPARVRFTLPDVSHTFRPGHRLIVHVQSSWFPLFDRNPQTFVDIYSAAHSDFVTATHTVYRHKAMPSSLTFLTLGAR